MGNLLVECADPGLVRLVDVDEFPFKECRSVPPCMPARPSRRQKQGKIEKSCCTICEISSS